MLATSGQVNAEGDFAAPFMTVAYKNGAVLFHPNKPLLHEEHSSRHLLSARDDDKRF